MRLSRSGVLNCVPAEAGINSRSHHRVRFRLHLVGQRPSIKDVAALAGVSTATVSRVVNNHAVQPAFRESVLAAVQELGYRRSGLARGLRRQTSTVLGIVIPDIENPFFTTVARAVQDTAAQSGFLVVVCNSDEDYTTEKEYVELLVDQQIAGLIIAPADESHSDVSPFVRDRIPVVAVDRKLSKSDFDTVMLDNVSGGELATATLIEAGYRNVATIAGPERTTSGSERLAGYRKALKAAGRRYRQRLVVDGDYRVEGGYRATLHLLRHSDPPDAIFIANNLMTIGAMQALEELGVQRTSIPLVTFDDLALGARRGMHSTVGQPAYDMGRTAAAMLFERIEGFDGAARELRLALQRSLQDEVQRSTKSPKLSPE